MLKRNWYFIFGTFFVVLGVLSLFFGTGLDAAWAITLGVGNLFIGYGQRHPEQANQRWIWLFVIPWLVLLIALTLLRLRTQ
jgi:hypothetical protein